MIRIVAGKARGRKLKVPKGTKVRPSAARVREALFSSLGARVTNAKVLDLFAGSGAFGLEALSRGAVFAVFVEIDKSARESLKKNIAELGFSGETKVIPGDAFKAVSLLKNEKRVFNLVFLDPPYSGGLLEKSIAAICAAGLLAPEGLIVAEHAESQKLPDFFARPCRDREGKESMSDEPKNLRKVVSKRYGDTGLTFFE